MEHRILDELLTWSSSRKKGATTMQKRFKTILSLFVAQRSFKIIKVAGTNGKGSTAAMLSSCLVQEQLKVGLFTSPHLLSINERFRINGKKITLDEVIEVAQDLKITLERMVQSMGSAFIPSFFEILILIALILFDKKGVDVGIFEAGIGGENDSTSLLPSMFSLLTTIGLDHTEQLGETIEEIALDKTGIANPETTLIINSHINKSIKKLILGKAAQNQVQLIESKKYINRHKTNVHKSEVFATIDNKEITLSPSLKGAYQKENINLVIEAFLFLKRQGIVQSINSLSGINTTRWEARFEIIGQNPTWILDAAHNPPAFIELIRTVSEVSSKRERVLLFGNSVEKDFKEILKLLPILSEKIYLVDNFYKSIKQNVLVENINNDFIQNLGDSKILENVNKIVIEHPNKIIVVAGSIFMVGQVRELLNRKHITT